MSLSRGGLERGGLSHARGALRPSSEAEMGCASKHPPWRGPSDRWAIAGLGPCTRLVPFWSMEVYGLFAF
jgi:hypothetical protein